MATATQGTNFEIVILNDQGQAAEAIVADGALREAHADAAEFTRYPVGEGLSVSDHHIVAPSLVSVDLIVSDTPKSTPSSITEPGFEIVNQRVALANGGSVNAQGPTQFIERGNILYSRLYQLMVDGTAVSITTSRRSYSNMVITRLTMDVSTSERSTVVSADFEQVRYVASATTEIKRVDVAKLRPPKTKGGQPTDAKNPPTGAAETASTNRSTLKTLQDGFNNLING